jgi:hypothetical protein
MLIFIWFIYSWPFIFSRKHKKSSHSVDDIEIVSEKDKDKKERKKKDKTKDKSDEEKSDDEPSVVTIEDDGADEEEKARKEKEERIAASLRKREAEVAKQLSGVPSQIILSLISRVHD